MRWSALRPGPCSGWRRRRQPRDGARACGAPNARVGAAGCEARLASEAYSGISSLQSSVGKFKSRALRAMTTTVVGLPTAREFRHGPRGCGMTRTPAPWLSARALTEAVLALRPLAGETNACKSDESPRQDKPTHDSVDVESRLPLHGAVPQNVGPHRFGDRRCTASPTSLLLLTVVGRADAGPGAASTSDSGSGDDGHSVTLHRVAKHAVAGQNAGRLIDQLMHVESHCLFLHSSACSSPHRAAVRGQGHYAKGRLTRSEPPNTARRPTHDSGRKSLRSRCHSDGVRWRSMSAHGGARRGALPNTHQSTLSGLKVVTSPGGSRWWRGPTLVPTSGAAGSCWHSSSAHLISGSHLSSATSLRLI